MADLPETALELLTHLATVPGCDIWSFDQATAGRELEAARLVRIVKAKERPPGHMRQPYYGIKISRAGRNHLVDAGITERTPWRDDRAEITMAGNPVEVLQIDLNQFPPRPESH